MKYKKKLIKYYRYIQLDKNKFIKYIIIIIVLNFNIKFCIYIYMYRILEFFI